MATFEQLYYVPTAEGLGKGAGFQFKAISPNARQFMTEIQEYCFYHTPSGSGSRETGYKPSFSFLPLEDRKHFAFLYTVYLGSVRYQQTRPGAFLTHALVTDVETFCTEMDANPFNLLQAAPPNQRYNPRGLFIREEPSEQGETLRPLDAEINVTPQQDVWSRFREDSKLMAQIERLYLCIFNQGETKRPIVILDEFDGIDVELVFQTLYTLLPLPLKLRCRFSTYVGDTEEYRKFDLLYTLSGLGGRGHFDTRNESRGEKYWVFDFSSEGTFSEPAPEAFSADIIQHWQNGNDDDVLNRLNLFTHEDLSKIQTLADVKFALLYRPLNAIRDENEQQTAIQAFKTKVNQVFPDEAERQELFSKFRDEYVRAPISELAELFVEPLETYLKADGTLNLTAENQENFGIFARYQATAMCAGTLQGDEWEAFSDILDDSLNQKTIDPLLMPTLRPIVEDVIDTVLKAFDANRSGRVLLDLVFPVVVRLAPEELNDSEVKKKLAPHLRNDQFVNRLKTALKQKRERMLADDPADFWKKLCKFLINQLNADILQDGKVPEASLELLHSLLFEDERRPGELTSAFKYLIDEKMSILFQVWIENYQNDVFSEISRKGKRVFGRDGRKRLVAILTCLCCSDRDDIAWYDADFSAMCHAILKVSEIEPDRVDWWVEAFQKISKEAKSDEKLLRCTWQMVLWSLERGIDTTSKKRMGQKIRATYAKVNKALCEFRPGEYQPVGQLPTDEDCRIARLANFISRLIDGTANPPAYDEQVYLLAQSRVEQQNAEKATNSPEFNSFRERSRDLLEKTKTRLHAHPNEIFRRRRFLFQLVYGAHRRCAKKLHELLSGLPFGSVREDEQLAFYAADIAGALLSYKSIDSTALKQLADKVDSKERLFEYTIMFIVSLTKAACGEDLLEMRLQEIASRKNFRGFLACSETVMNINQPEEILKEYGWTLQ